MLPSVLAMVASTVHKFMSLLWERATEEASLEDMMEMVTMNMGQGFVLNSEVHNTLKGFISKLDQAEEKSKKLSNDLQAILKIKIDVAAVDVRQGDRRDKQLAEALDELERVKEELAIVKASMVEAKVKAVRLYIKNFPSTLEYTHLATRFIKL
ncbi:hypothetical protein Adt_27303 [Abeliophyllum distichum]|uniref:Uncharacterized protein n=1 Tax=Abeliophyllum distichum TaxID=126358 RepID=A0ABD1RTE7_9LAMI